MQHLRISARIGNDKESRLLESLLDLIGEGTRSVPTSQIVCTSVLAKLQDRTLTIRPCRNHDNWQEKKQSSDFLAENSYFELSAVLTVRWVLNGDNNARSQHELLPSLREVDDVQTISTTLPNVRSLPGTISFIPSTKVYKN